MREAEELSEPTELYYAHPLDVNKLCHISRKQTIVQVIIFSFNKQDNIFEWHFTIRGPADTDFEGGIYHGRILLPAEYPMKPPSIIMLTVIKKFY